MTARAVLRLEMEGAADITRSIGQIRGVVRATQSAMNAEARRGGQDRKRIASDEARAQAAAAREAERARARAERETSRLVAAEARKRAQTEQKAAQERRRAEQEATRLVASETKKRARIEADFAREVDRIHVALSRARERQEREATRTVRREARERSRIAREEERTYRRGVGGLVRGIGSVGAGAAGLAREVQGDVQGARARAATPEHTLNQALNSARIYGVGAAAMRQQVMDFAWDRGMDPQALAEGIGSAQERFSVLAQPGVSGQDALRQQLDLAEFAQSTYQSPAEVLRIAGMLGQQGVRGPQQREMLLAMTGMAQAGSIELGSVTSQALGPMMQNISRSVNANMTGEQRSAAVRRAVSQSMAEAEIGAAAGLGPRDSLNALAKMRTSLTSDRTASNLRGRLRGAGAQGQAALAALYDRQGHLSTQDPVQFMSRLVSAFGGDTNRVTNLLSAGGPGSPMVLDSQQRRLIGAMASQTEGGETIQQRVDRMIAAGTSFSETNVAQGRDMVQNETATQLQRDENARMQALTGNTQAGQSLSNRIAAFEARNPISSKLGLAAGAGVLGTLARSPTALGATLLASGTFANLGAAVTGTDASGRHLGPLERIARGGLGVAAAIPGGGLLAGATQAAVGLSDVARGAANGNANGALASAVDRLTALLQGGQLRATIDPHDAALAASQAASGHSPPPPDRR